MPTLDDVGKAAGVSRGTVSNVFNRPERVRPELRKKVEEAARMLGYGGPDPKGRLLKEGRFNAIGFMPPGAYAISEVIRSPYGRELLQGAAMACDAAGATLSLVNGTDETRTATIREALVDGFILGNVIDIELVASAKRRRLPFVILESDVGPDVNSIRIDGRAGARAAVEHLLALGHKRFAILSIRHTAGPAIVHPPGEGGLVAGFALDHERMQGFLEAMARGGLSIGDMPVIETRPGDPEAGALVFDHCADSTAILTMSDWQAITVLDEAARRGIDVPGHVSVVGFDGTEESARTTPPLTTVAHDVVGKGRLAAEMVLENGPPRQVLLPVTLMVRGSTGTPRTAPATGKTDAG
jgi:DNA-binding LacI/PurR family transcriptional regulator